MLCAGAVYWRLLRESYFPGDTSSDGEMLALKSIQTDRLN